MNEFRLIERLRQGDDAALAEAIERYSGYVMAVVQHTLGTQASMEDKKELVSDVFVTLWRVAARLDAQKSLKLWFAVVARNRSLKWRRNFKGTEELHEDSLVSDEDVVTAPAERHEEAALVQNALAALDEENRTIFVRHYFEQESVGAIASATGMKESTVKSRLRRGRNKLKEQLLQEGYLP
jgi:RNA polymerase sigma-70 factor (ECF subfamily)